ARSPVTGPAPGRSASGPGSSRNTLGSRSVSGRFRGSTQDPTALAGLTVLLVLSVKTAEQSSDRPVKGFARTAWAAAALGPSIEVVANARFTSSKWLPALVHFRHRIPRRGARLLIAQPGEHHLELIPDRHTGQAIGVLPAPFLASAEG